jgi:hypothetical protein
MTSALETDNRKTDMKMIMFDKFVILFYFFIYDIYLIKIIDKDKFSI